MRRGEIWLINLDPTVGAEIMKTRPAVIVSDDAIGVLLLKVIVPITDWGEGRQPGRGELGADEGHLDRARRPTQARAGDFGRCRAGSQRSARVF
jgi:mRNA-degrading endonuclease toxin of MazEF toxin-antitoxin module